MNEHRGEVDVRLGGASYVLRYDANALVLLEHESGITVTQLATAGETALNGVIGIKFIRAALYAGLKGSNQRLTIERVGEMIDLMQLGYYSQQVAKALALAMGGPGGNADAPGPESASPGAGTGNGSGGPG